LRPLFEPIRQEGWGSAEPPHASTVEAVTRTGHPVAEFLSTTDAPRVAQELGIPWSAMTSLIVSGVDTLLSSVDISVRPYSSTLKTGATVQWTQGLIEINRPADIVATQGRELVSALLKAQEASKTKGFDETDEKIFAAMLYVDKTGQVP